MFEQTLKEEYFRACAVSENLKAQGAATETKRFAAGYAKGLEYAMEQYDKLFDPPMSDEDYIYTLGTDKRTDAGNVWH